MRAGRLRHRGVIQYLATGSPQYSASGEPNQVWTNLDSGDGESWMSIDPLRGNALFAAQEHGSNVTVSIRTRYRSDVVTTKRQTAVRVSHGGTYYMVEAVVDFELRHRELELFCSEGKVELPA